MNGQHAFGGRTFTVLGIAALAFLVLPLLIVLPMLPMVDRPVDSTSESFVFEITGSCEKVDAFIDLMRPLGMTDVARTGSLAIARGR